MEEFLTDYVQMIFESMEGNENKTLSKGKLKYIVNEIMNNDNVWETLDNEIRDLIEE